MRTVIELDDEEADRIMAAATGKARELGIAVSVAVVDRGGRLKRFTRMDGAEIAGEVLAPHKAYSAIANSCDTSELAAQAGPDGGLRGIEAAAGGAFTIVGGGAVLRCRGELIGAVGVSGGTAQEDSQSAAAGRDCVRRAAEAASALGDVSPRP
jgi:uncharacterized protein GlcG (DUF336 family)